MELNREQIIKALGCCASDNGIGACESGCPLFEIEPCPCIDEPNEILHCALSLIKELTEENERLRADTVRKMQARLKEEKTTAFGSRCEVVPFYVVDQIAKEMLEGTE